MRRIVLSLILLLAAFPALAAPTFFWRAEGTTLDGTHDYSAGDDSAATGGGSPEINTDVVKVGTNSVDCTTGSSYYEFDSAGIVVNTEGRVGFWFYQASGWSDGQVLWRTLDASSANMQLAVWTLGTSGTGNVRLRIGNPGNGATDIDTSSLSLATGNWYFIDVAWQASSTSGKVSVFDADLSQIGSTAADTSVPSGNFPSADIDVTRIGQQSGGAGVAHLDNIMVSDDYDEDLTAFANYSSYTEFGGGSIVPIIRRIRD